MKPLYTAQALATGDGRNGRVASVDGLVDFALALPKEMGGAGGAPNPELLFAAGYAACFHNALRLVAKKAKQDVEGSTVGADVTIGANSDGTFGLSVVLEVVVPGVTEETLRGLITTADRVCPYSNAVRGNITVDIRVGSAG
jgi:osmotically inducible protein OsmC